MSAELVIRTEAEWLELVHGMRELVERLGTLDETQEARARMRAAEAYAKAKLSRQHELAALVARRWIERRAGELIAADPDVKRGGSKYRAGTLKTLGVTAKESSRWQKLAALSEDAFESLVEATIADTEREGQKAARAQRMAATRERNAKREEQARVAIAELGGGAYELELADLADWRPTGVDAIVTDPPYIGPNVLELYVKLRDFAVDCLRPGGALVVMTSQRILDGVFEALACDELAYRWAIAWRYTTRENTVDHPRRVFDSWKPILVWHRGAMPADAPPFYDVIENDDADKSVHVWGQSLEGMGRLVRAFSAPGELVCDPFLGGGTTALAALELGRRFVGCDVDAQAVEASRRRLDGGGA